MYEAFAYVYDLFMESVPYEKWGEQIHNILIDNQIENGLVLDLGCGTGIMTRIFRDYGYDMIGVDNSDDMLMVAREAEYDEIEDEVAEKSEILYLCQDMRDIQLYGTVRSVISVCDCLNYITDIETLTGVFSLVANYLDAGGLFIWDMNTPYKYSNIPDTIAENQETAAFIWNNDYDENTHLNTYEVNLFIKDEEEDFFNRETEIHVQRAYTLEEVKGALDVAGMELVKIIDCDTGDDITETTARWLFVARELPREGKLYV